MSASRTKRTKHKYFFDEERGIVAVGNLGVETQAIQLLHGPASMNFRRKCGLLLAQALNRDIEKLLKRVNK